MKQTRIFWEIPRAKKKLLFPKALNEDELRQMFSAVTNQKYRAIFFTAYSAGLRVSNTLSLRISDIDSGRMQIRVADSKGGKDRYVQPGMLTPDGLPKYLTGCKPRPLM